VKPDPTYWGVLCRTCAELVAFGASPVEEDDIGAEGSKPGTIRCPKGHTHIYFPRDFRLFPSAAAIEDTTMRANLKVYKTINPYWKDSCDTSPLEQAIQCSNVRSFDCIQKPSASLGPDPRRQNAKKAAGERWANWARKKAAKPQ
jgi:hypothetical protein